MHKGMRQNLVNILKTKGITDPQVLDAINTIPRHFFLDSAFDKIAYEDRAFEIGEGQTISQPYTVAYQTQLLQIKKNEKVLEIGTGSVYQATILAQLGTRVFTIERQHNLFKANENFYFKPKFPNLKFFYGDGFAGLPTYAPFDKIIITAAAPFVPPKLLQQLKINGIMVLPVDEGNSQRMMRITKTDIDTFVEEKFDLFSFVPMLDGKNS
jgi:protein-L-isoaspartate(D-aspartate) O-methyltransferase